MSDKYDSLTKDQLLGEVAKRKLEGRILQVGAQDKKEDITSALLVDDENKESAKKASESEGVPVVPEKELPQASKEITDGLKYSGVYIKSDDGEPYALAVVKDAPGGRTHFAKNNIHFWNGTETDFRLLFDKQ